MRAAARPNDKAKFLTTKLHTEIVEGHVQELTCRVCSEPILIGDPHRARQWHLEYAHPDCGWFKADEDRSVHPRRRPGTYFEYFEWMCPNCGLDACAPRKPRATDDMRCRRCNPLPEELEPGVRVECLYSFYIMREVKGRKPRRVNVEPYTRGELVKVHGDPLNDGTALVRWEGNLGESWVRSLMLKPV